MCVRESVCVCVCVSVYMSQQALIYVDASTTAAVSDMNPTGCRKQSQRANVCHFLSKNFWKLISTRLIKLQPLWNLKAVADGSIFLASCSLEGDAGVGG